MEASLLACLYVVNLFQHFMPSLTKLLDEIALGESEKFLQRHQKYLWTDERNAGAFLLMLLNRIEHIEKAVYRKGNAQ